MIITIKNGEQIHLQAGLTCKELAAEIGDSLARTAVCARVDGQLVDLNYKVEQNCRFEIVGLKEKEGLDVYRHTAAHILAQALKIVYPTCKLAEENVTENGFYYDVEFNTPISGEDLSKVEEEMKKIVKSNLTIEHFFLPRAEAMRLMTKFSEKYKVRAMKELSDNVEFCFYKQGDFIDFCDGPHLISTGKLKSFKLTNISGAYWRRNERNKMLTRIYGVAFARKDELDGYFRRLEQAKQREHIKLGKELKLFSMQKEAKGFPFFLPNGATVKNALIEYERTLNQRDNYQEIGTPLMLPRKAWEETLGQNKKNKDVFTAKAGGEECVINSVSDPGYILVYRQSLHSYKDFPIRLSEFGFVHRLVKSGQLRGLLRTRCFTLDEGCVFLTDSQIKDEISSAVRVIDEVYSHFGLKYEAILSEGNKTQEATILQAFQNALSENNITYKTITTTAYAVGPELSFYLFDAQGRKWKCGVITFDLAAPLRYELAYTGEDGKIQRPLLMRRFVFGSLERFIAIITEEFGGKFPVWLAPIQATVISVSQKYFNYAERVCTQLKENGIRSETDCRDKSVNYKIRDAYLKKIPYILVVGQKEAASGNVSICPRGRKAQKNLSVENFVCQILREIEEKIIF